MPNDDFIPFHKPSIGEEEIEGVAQVLRSGWLTTGPKTREFEEKFALFTGCRYAVAVNSCTAALHLALDAIGLKEGEEVLVPTLTFTATAEVVAYFKAKPVLVDSEPCYFNLDVHDAEKKITAKTRAVIPVHFAGHPCDMTALLELATAKGLLTIEDAAHALPAKYRGRYVGILGPLTAFSFYVTKTITTGEGGMVTTNDERLASRIRLMRLHGISRDAWKRYSAEGSWRYEVLEAGFKYNLTDLQAALGLAQLGKCNAMWRRRVAIAERYNQGLSMLDAYRTPRVAPHVQHAWHLYVILVESDVLGIHRDQVIEELHHRGIGTAVHFIPLHLHPYYQRQWGYRAGQFPVAENYFERCISLPIYPGMTDNDVDRVIESLIDIVQKCRR
ncbi:MAG: DegT/DnrJ/EryC1/StrS aminotransferase family protein [Terriglobia bacterium]|jgi:perosamine synthetase